MGGVIGFDYNVFLSSMDRMKLTDKAYDQLFEDIRYIESIAIPEMNKKD